MENIFDAAFVHFQGPKVHAIVYRPIDQATKIADKAVLMQLALHDFAKNVFNGVSGVQGDFKVASGSDLGNAIGTRNGQQSDRELLFIGDPANQAAKVIGSGGTARIRPRVYEALSDDVKAICTPNADSSFYTAAPSTEKLVALLKDRGITWDHKALEALVKAKEGTITLDEIEYSDANEKIDPDSLSIRNNKRVTAASIFADLSGFTKYVESKTDNAGKKGALRVFHAIRRESSLISKTDYDGVRIQYQGDRIQAIFHIPKGEEAKFALEALKAAAAMHSAIEDTLREKLPDIKDIHYAIGIDVGSTLVTKLGSHGQRDRICLGTAVENAQKLEDKNAQAEQTAISRKIYDLLPEYAQKPFTMTDDYYVVTGLTLDALEKAQQAMKGGAVNVAKTTTGMTVSSSGSGTRVEPAKSWGN
ncbi:MAG TPA: adenylate/guanylate cyclase domain-containing protein [Candidatus Tumulicola sp.]|nr:adenylate/guanylate cyclase domain-containing protein [Candidatus Tumulicola sp.]